MGVLFGGGGVSLSPADDTLIRIERAMNIDAQDKWSLPFYPKKYQQARNTL